MIKKLILLFLLFCSIGATAQLNNSWIDYSKTYYKFKLGEDNLYRIPQSAFAAVGLGTTNADHFQLWRNGVEVRLYTPITAAPLGTSDYVEFYGEMNDGKADKTLYRNPQFQLADRYSLETDTAAYFLTVNPASVNLRYTITANPAPPTGTVADAYFMRKVDLFYRKQYSRGFATDFGEYVYSSAYDEGEGPVSLSVSALPATTAAPVPLPTIFTETFSDLNVYYGGPQNALSIRTKVFFTTANSYRKVNLKASNVTVIPTLPSPSPSTNPDMITTGLKSLSVIANNLSLATFMPNGSTMPLSFVLTNNNPAQPSSFPQPPIDNMVIATVGITYPATFNFNNTKSFAFELAASSTGNYLIIDNFNYGTVAPLLLDMNTGKRFTGDITTPGKVKFMLPASTDIVRKFILYNMEASNIKTISALASNTFVDYNAAANKGDYIIISHPKLYDDGAGVNNVELYRAYRSTANGGGYNAKVADINELTDQFAFGIKSHPVAIRDFLRFMDANYTVKPKAIFLIGRGISYYDKKSLELNTATYATNAPLLDKLDFIPTFGWPPSDVLLASPQGQVNPITPIGRLGAIDGKEVGYYYQKMLQYEQAQRLQSPLIADKAWMKNTMQIVGGRTDPEVATFNFYMDGYKDSWIKEPFFGGNVDRFSKTQSGVIENADNIKIAQDLTDGVGFIKYFGHSSASTFEFNLSDPYIYNNVGKYPFFHVSGCTAGNYYNFDPTRVSTLSTLSEKYVLANQRGSIAFLADTHFGIPGYLNYFNDKFHENFCKTAYGQTVGQQIKNVITTLGGANPSLDYNTRIHIEEINLHGDPALKINNFPKADYVIEPQLIKVSPSIITVSDQSFNVKAIWRNIGKATEDSIRVIVKRTLSNNVVEVLKDTMIFATKYMDSLELTIPISPLKDKGNNKICIELDHTDLVNELYETNNKACTDFFIFEATLSPIYPYNYAIINTQNITYSASTANPLLPVTSNYIMEIDTTALFNSPFKKAYNRTGLGGLIEFNPTNITFTDSTVYYWRTAVIPASGNTIWNTASFVYLPNSTSGFNQSHYYQHLDNTYDNKMYLDADRQLKFKNFDTELKVSHGNYPPNDFPVDFVSLGSSIISRFGSVYGTLQFVVLDGVTGNPLRNGPNGNAGLYGSLQTGLSSIVNQFQFNFNDNLSRNKIARFIDSMPNNASIYMYGHYFTVDNALPWASQWTGDTVAPGSKNLHQTFLNYGLKPFLDSFYRNRPMFFKFTKNNPANLFYKIGDSARQLMVFNIPINISNTSGELKSPVYGPARAWGDFHWRGYSLENPTRDRISFKLIGINNAGVETDLITLDSTQKDVNISFVNATTYPFIKVVMNNADSGKGTPYQLRYMRLNYTPVPEGAIYPSLSYSMKDIVDAGEPIQFTLAFKNVSKVNFSDSMKIGLTIRTNNNFDSIINLPKAKILVAGDYLTATYTIPSENFVGNNTLIIDFNPGNAQPEQYHFNNILYKDFYVRGDEVDPLLDVTFDGIHILNKDIVSSKPNILIKLKDENRFLALTDNSLLKVKIKYPGESNYRNFNFNSDTMRFTPAVIGSGDNTAKIDLKPYCFKDGEYELVVSGKDVTGNKAGDIDYRSTFTVINKPMISEMLNYPNPFTTSTAFVFTLTGSQVPQNIRIQILTISGKIVKEITKAELGDIHIGRNITEYKWDGTDMFNQQVANGVYLYRVITNLNGKSLDKYIGEGDNSSKYFNKGYGKMYLMR
jgi:hypothetical protein